MSYPPGIPVCSSNGRKMTGARRGSVGHGYRRSPRLSQSQPPGPQVSVLTRFAHLRSSGLAISSPLCLDHLADRCVVESQGSTNGCQGIPVVAVGQRGPTVALGAGRGPMVTEQRCQGGAARVVLDAGQGLMRGSNERVRSCANTVHSVAFLRSVSLTARLTVL
jgi:hypothetical protein